MPGCMPIDWKVFFLALMRECSRSPKLEWQFFASFGAKCILWQRLASGRPPAARKTSFRNKVSLDRWQDALLGVR